LTFEDAFCLHNGVVRVNQTLQNVMRFLVEWKTVSRHRHDGPWGWN